MDKIDQFQEIINNSKKIVFFGGAGVSTESGIPDFRSVDGLYSMKYDYLPEEILSNTFFRKNINESLDEIKIEEYELDSSYYGWTAAR